MSGWISLAVVASTLAAELPDVWFRQPILPRAESERAMARWIETALAPIEPPADVEEWSDRSDTIRAALVEATGLSGVWPPTWPLNVQVKRTLRRDGYRIELLTYESWPDMAVPALLYVPDRIPVGGAPGIVSISGHDYKASKAADYVQTRNVNLVRRGLVVLSYDYMNCFERHTGGDGDGESPTAGGGGNDHGIRGFSFSDRNPTTLEILDARRALDVLASRPEVDSERLGFTGESGGSNSTYWVGALDDRVKLAVPVCSVTTFDYWIRNDRNWDWHQRPFGARRLADIGVLLGLRAPRPTLIVTAKRGTDDHEFPREEAERSYRWASDVYRLYGPEAAGKVAFVESSTGHGYQADKRAVLYQWAERELLGQPSGITGEIEVAPEPLETLRVGLPSSNKTYLDIYRDWVSALAEPPEPKAAIEVEAFADRARPLLAARLGFPINPGLADFQVVRRDDGEDGTTATFLALVTEPGLRIPVAEFRPPGDGPWNVELMVGPREAMKGAVGSALAAGRMAVVVEPRGTGEIAWGGRPTDNAGWFLGRTRVAQETYDILRAAALWLARPDVASVSVAAEGRLGKAALLAAALDTRLAGLAASVPATDRAQFEANGRESLADVPGMLAVADLPQLAAMVAPRPCALRVPEPAAYAWTEAAYRAFEAPVLILKALDR